MEYKKNEKKQKTPYGKMYEKIQCGRGKGRCKGYVFLPDHTIMEEQDRERSRSLWNLKK